MPRILSVLILIVLFVSGCTIHKRQYRDGWYINRHTVQEQQWASYCKPATAPDTPDVESRAEMELVPVTDPDTSAIPKDSVHEKGSPEVIVVPPRDTTKTMTFPEAKASLATKGIPMDPFLEVGYYLSYALLITASLLWPVSFVFLIIGYSKRRKYASSDAPGSKEHTAIATRMIRLLAIGLLVAAAIYALVISFFLLLSW